MLANSRKHDQFSSPLAHRLNTTGMGLGLVRLLLDAGRADEARTALSSLQQAFQGTARTSSSIKVRVQRVRATI
ncbi:hypothetical protein AYO44_05485 [Planctomycetaceae bacterium SCGC AG-212-F19]|nr:hypothetical protein AYO44_05485 [Planctomycetaceae bacterium SCGC AG-212-F19]